MIGRKARLFRQYRRACRKPPDAVVLPRSAPAPGPSPKKLGEHFSERAAGNLSFAGFYDLDRAASSTGFPRRFGARAPTIPAKDPVALKLNADRRRGGDPASPWGSTLPLISCYFKHRPQDLWVGTKHGSGADEILLQSRHSPDILGRRDRKNSRTALKLNLSLTCPCDFSTKRDAKETLCPPATFL